MEGRKRRGRESGGGGKGKRGERNRSKKDGGGEGTKEGDEKKEAGYWFIALRKYQGNTEHLNTFIIK